MCGIVLFTSQRKPITLFTNKIINFHQQAKRGHFDTKQIKNNRDPFNLTCENSARIFLILKS